MKLSVYCWRNGRIHFGRKVPEGALCLGVGPAKAIRDAVCVMARLSYPKQRGGRDQYPLVPGVPEAKDDNQALEAVVRFAAGLRLRVKGAA